MRCVLVHGALADARTWDPLIPWFQGHEPISYDLRGHGQMDDADGDFHHVDDLLDLLEEQPAVLVGAGLGARVCVEAALLRPELVLRLVQLSPAFGDWTWEPAPGASGLAAAMQSRAVAVHAALAVQETARVRDVAERGVDCPVLVLDEASGPPIAAFLRELA